MYERTTAANSALSDWNAEAVVVPKPGEPEGGEMRITFNYSNVHEDMPGSCLQLASEVHDYLSDPRHGCFMQFDIKHAYWSIPVHPEDRYFFAFFADGIGQLQPTRMPQGSRSAGYSMNELMFIAFGYIPPLPDGTGEEPSLLAALGLDMARPLMFYMDDLFNGGMDAERGIEFLRDHFLPRAEWSMMRLSFKKLRLFQEEIEALGIIHRIHGVIKHKESRTVKIKSFPVPLDPTGIKSFLGTVGITRAWVANFAEIARPLNRLLAKDEPFDWGIQQQASFDILREKCSAAVDAYGIDYTKPIRLYSDASGYAGGCCITQMRENPNPPETEPKKGRKKLMEVPILFDSFAFSAQQRNYSTYKRELCAIVEFVRKYRHLFHATEPAVIYTDHKPLTRFLASPLVEGIYARWHAEISAVNAVIEWIPGKRNVVADSLSRTVFPDVTGEDAVLQSLGYIDESEGQSQWVWKDGKGGYEELLRLRREEELNATDSTTQLDVCTARLILSSCPAEVAPESISRPYSPYYDSAWYGDIYAFLSTGRYPAACTSKLQKRAFLHKVKPYMLLEGELFYEWRGVKKRCVMQEDVAELIYACHDKAGHWAVEITNRKLRPYYWPTLAQDVRDYIKGCLSCAKNSTAQRSQLASPVTVEHPNTLLGMDFVGPFGSESLTSRQVAEFTWPQLYSTESGRLRANTPLEVELEDLPAETSKPFTYILVVVDYFSRFTWAFPCTAATSSETARCLQWIFQLQGPPIAIYSDEGTHFSGKVTQEFLSNWGVLWIPSPVAAKKATGMVEKVNDLHQRVMRKSKGAKPWPLCVQPATFELNKREIPSLNYTPFEIHFGWQPPAEANSDPRFTTYTHVQARSFLLQPPESVFEALTVDSFASKVESFLEAREELRSRALYNSNQAKALSKAAHDYGLTERSFAPGDLVLLHDLKAKKKSFQPIFVGPFRVVGFGGSHDKSYVLEQLNKKPIPRIFYGDHLRLFVPRTGHLVPLFEESYPLQQNIRTGNYTKKS
jgi:hypothetical protein